MPLLLRGARQIGKTHSSLEFGRSHFQNVFSINFELERAMMDNFDDPDPHRIVKAIAAIKNEPIIPGQTLLFLDEIQECPNAILSLRYFKELMPELHVLAAGSLLEFTLNDPSFRMPVGRVQSLFMKPLSFEEYLLACDYKGMLDYIKNSELKTGIPESVHVKLLNLLHEYFVVGGMPAVVSNYLEHRDFKQTQVLQNALLGAYRSDFGKYASKAQNKYLQALFDKAPGMVGEHFQYVKVNPHMQSRDIRSAVTALKDAGLIYTVYSTAASGLPLNSYINEKKFKLLFLDIGLLKATADLETELLKNQNLMLANRGKLTEQFVGQELLAYRSPHLNRGIYYWERHKKSSTAEVDYVIHVSERILPIEVKAGATGRLKSLHLFLEEKSGNLGLQISTQPLSLKKELLSVPLYMISEIPRLVSSVSRPQ